MAYDRAIATTICERIAAGESLRAICRDEGMPSRELVRQWLADPENEEFVGQYARAREHQAETYADDIVSIADAAPIGGEQVAKLQIDARKWAASKLAPKKYGDKVTNEHTGEGGGAIRVEFVKASAD